MKFNLKSDFSVMLVIFQMLTYQCRYLKATILDRTNKNSIGKYYPGRQHEPMSSKVGGQQRFLK